MQIIYYVCINESYSWHFIKTSILLKTNMMQDYLKYAIHIFGSGGLLANSVCILEGNYIIKDGSILCRKCDKM